MRLDVDAKRGALFELLVRARPAYRSPIVKMLAAATVTPRSGEILRQAAIDASVDPVTRASALTALSTATGTGALEQAIDGFSSLPVAAPDLPAPLDSVWRQFVSSGAHAPNVQTFRDLTTSKDPARQILGYSVLLQLAAEPVATGRGARGGGGGGRGGRGSRGGPSAAAIESARATARKDIDAAWQGPSVASLLRAIGATEATGYADRIQPFLTGASPDIRAAAAFARDALASSDDDGERCARVDHSVCGSRCACRRGDGGRAPRQDAVHAPGVRGVPHRVTEETEKGPYLGGIATRYSRAELIESIVRPAARSPGALRPTSSTWPMGDISKDSSFVKGNRGRATRPGGCRNDGPKDQIKARGVREGSIMPPGLADSLTLQEFASLLAYLGSTTGK